MEHMNLQGAGQRDIRQQQGPPRYDGQEGRPLYDHNTGGHYGASASIAASGNAPAPETFIGPWANVSQGLQGQYRDILNTYWQQQVTKLETEDHDYKIHQLPLARIKKVMKADPEVKMISAEAPILFAKGCDIFITELTMRAWIHAEENKRRTLQRSDIASALAKSDMFDFLIDIVPREEAQPNKRRDFGQSQSLGVQPGGQQPAPGQPAVGGMQPPPPQQPPPGGHAGQQHLDPQHYGMPGMPASDHQEYGQPGMYPPPPPGQPPGAAAYGQPAPPPQMFDQSAAMYAGYNMSPQQVSLPPDHPPPVAGRTAVASSQSGPMTLDWRRQREIAGLRARQMYQMQRPHEQPMSAGDPGQHYGRHEGGEGEADAEGERDYEVA
ncbi:MAG: hypothetical protein M1821_009084 [Bathelium mastoideum]|nr:MAG: hypothetical protein M1821_009084 [Bathelium mastoideum]